LLRARQQPATPPPTARRSSDICAQAAPPPPPPPGADPAAAPTHREHAQGAGSRHREQAGGCCGGIGGAARSVRVRSDSSQGGRACPAEAATDRPLIRGCFPLPCLATRQYDAPLVVGIERRCCCCCCCCCNGSAGCCCCCNGAQPRGDAGAVCARVSSGATATAVFGFVADRGRRELWWEEVPRGEPPPGEPRDGARGALPARALPDEKTASITAGTAVPDTAKE
jgi:hypothetical protein